MASAVRQVDRLVSRGTSNQGRSLELTVPVRGATRWKRISPDLEGLLHWLTDDSWRLRFDSSDGGVAVQQNLFDEHPIPNAEAIALFSGGLDSVAGADIWLAAKTPTYLLNISGDNVQAKHAASAAAHIRERYPGRTDLIAMRHQLRSGRIAENSQRSRGFFFFALAVAIAHAIEIQRIVTFEAGVGALNLPMNAAQTGADNTRAMHPRTLLLMQSLVNRLFDSEFSFEAPFLFMTKGEVCRSTPSGIEALAAVAYSCDVPQRQRPRPFEHCGFCTSCLFRRSALFSALGRNDPTNYRKELSSAVEPYEQWAFREQAHHFSTWRTASDVLAYAPHARWALDFAKQSPVFARRSEDDLAQLFRRHAAEASALFESSNSPRPLLSNRGRYALS